jgi:hypothetical protein
VSHLSLTHRASPTDQLPQYEAECLREGQFDRPARRSPKRNPAHGSGSSCYSRSRIVAGDPQPLTGDRNVLAVTHERERLVWLREDRPRISAQTANVGQVPNPNASRADLMDRLVNKDGGVRSEATIQSDVRMLLLDRELGLADVQLETQVGDAHKRIDVEVGCTVIEVKRTLASPAALAAATTQLTGYVVSRQSEMGQRYVGILTDGAMWVAFHEVDGELSEAARHQAAAGEAGAAPLLRWLEGVLATKTAVPPTPEEIHDRLGADSSSHALDFATLRALYDDHRDEPTVVLKRGLWANLLRSALGTQFTNSDELFLEHTLLVNSAEIIAHLVLGLDATQLSPATLLSGDEFSAVGLHGVVDRDFFDWVLEVPGGDGFISSLARRLARFDWSAVEHDVLKVLYESVIKPEVRKSLGEYYTPDWLAKRVVNEVVTDPLNQRVLDPVLRLWNVRLLRGPAVPRGG